jgi:RimJ/RimL family protein N-acetyltransferase
VTVSLSPITPGDVEEIDQWLESSDLHQFMSGWTPRAIREGDWQTARCRWEFIVCDDVRVGTAWLERESVDHPVAHLGILIADPQFRRKGIGTQVIRRMMDHALSDWESKTIKLRVRASNAEAIACYEKLAFVSTKTTTKLAGGDEITVVHMERQLAT